MFSKIAKLPFVEKESLLTLKIKDSPVRIVRQGEEYFVWRICLGKWFGRNPNTNFGVKAHFLTNFDHVIKVVSPELQRKIIFNIDLFSYSIDYSKYHLSLAWPK